MSEALERGEREGSVEAALRRFLQEAAWVEEVSPDLAVRSRSGAYRATVAASCLLRPETGDKVLLARSEDGGEAYVLAILTRARKDAPAEIAVEGDLHLESRSGKVEIAGRSGIRLLTPADLEAAAKGMLVKAQDAKLFLESMAYLGREVVSQVKVAKLAGGRLDGAWESVRQHAKRVYRTVTEGEHVRAQNLDVRCDQQLTLHGENASITAKQLVKMDAGQIVMG